MTKCKALPHLAAQHFCLRAAQRRSNPLNTVLKGNFAAWLYKAVVTIKNAVPSSTEGFFLSYQAWWSSGSGNTWMNTHQSSTQYTARPRPWQQMVSPPVIDSIWHTWSISRASGGLCRTDPGESSSMWMGTFLYSVFNPQSSQKCSETWRALK